MHHDATTQRQLYHAPAATAADDMTAHSIKIAPLANCVDSDTVQKSSLPPSLPPNTEESLTSALEYVMSYTFGLLQEIAPEALRPSAAANVAALTDGDLRNVQLPKLQDVLNYLKRK